MKQLADIFYSFMHPRWCFLATGIMLLYTLFVMRPFSAPFMDQLGPEAQMLDTRFGYSTQDAEAFFAPMDQWGFGAFLLFENIIDRIFPMIYGIFFLFWGTLLLSYAFPPESPFRVLNVIAIFSPFFDLLENQFIISMANEYSQFARVDDLTVGIASVMTQIKWVFAGLGLIVLLFAGIMALMARFKRA